MGVYYTDKDGTRKLVHFGSYGIGITRMIGTLVELFHDDKGIIWPKSVAPYKVHLIEIGKDAGPIYKTLEKEGIEVLYDDRDVSVGQKFADADLIGIPVRLVVSTKNETQIEWKERTSEKTELLSLDGVLKRFKKGQAA
jgi:prolyl-tRNA synthetase